eukprot:TRINITY_DN51750_c0_g1_i1.p1 TRINITY_DN51750_c0_g1~~TRINITY_DN51750_c0_g1_i1.p1  ORF type:complete len:402 (-),score=111.36 TRINITY_DN51750_c0_g1_i1:40-1245(-)
MVEGERRDAGSTGGGAAAGLDKVKVGFKGFKAFVNNIAENGVASPPESDTAASEGAAHQGADGGGAGAWLAWADKARKAVADKAREVAYDVVPQSDGQAREVTFKDGADLERGNGGADVPKWASWAKEAATKVRQQVTEKADEARAGLAQATEKAKSIEIGEQAKRLQGGVAGGLGRVADVGASATASLQEKGKVAQQKAKELQGKSQQKLGEASSFAAKKAVEAKEKSANVAGAAKKKLSEAGEGFAGLGALAMSPAKLAQFAGVFLSGTMLVSLSLSFLPVLVIAPQKFALLFAIGSMLMLGSFAVLKGPQAFAMTLIQREKLPFSGSYAIGLVGTLVATLIMKNYILTAFFGLMQVFALLYFLASFIPGGQAILNGCGRACKACAAKTICGKRRATTG